MSWAERKINELGDIVTGKTPSTKVPEYFGGEYPFVTPSDIDYGHYYVRITETTVTEQAKNKHKNQFIPKDSVLFTCIGNTMGKCAIASQECISNQQINSVVANDEHDPKFLYYLLHHNRNLVRGIGMGGGAATPIINKTTFGNIKLKVPTDKAEQEAISSLLEKYDDLIENNKRRIELLEESARQLYKEWFVRFRFPGHEHVKIIDGVPEGWKKTTYGEIAETVGGGTPSTKVPEYWEDGNVTWFVPKDLTNNNSLVLLDSEKKITRLGLQKSSAKILPPNTIMMSSRASIGYFGLYDGEASTNQGFISVMPKQQNTQMYLLHNLMSRKEEIIGLAGGTTYKEINKTTFRGIELLIPTDTLLDEFQDFSSDLVSQVRLMMKQIKQLTRARDLLLPKLMSGEITV